MLVDFQDLISSEANGDEGFLHHKPDVNTAGSIYFTLVALYILVSLHVARFRVSGSSEDITCSAVSICFETRNSRNADRTRLKESHVRLNRNSLIRLQSPH